MLATLAACGVTAVLLPFATALWQVYVLASGYLVAVCLFWAAMEHASTGLHTHLTLIQSTACFCAAFSLGNALGQMTSSLLQAQTVAVPFFVSAGLTVVIMALTWLTVSPEAGFRRSTPADIAAFPESSRQRLRRSLLAARTGLVGTYGMYALVCFFLPRYLWEHRGFSKPLAASLAAITLVTMSLTFAAHGIGKRWPHRLWVVRICPMATAAGAGRTGSPIHPGTGKHFLGGRNLCRANGHHPNRDHGHPQRVRSRHRRPPDLDSGCAETTSYYIRLGANRMGAMAG